MGAPPFVVAGKAMVGNGKGAYLFLQRSLSSNHFAGQWEMPGGKMDPGEIIETSIIRETKEETGLDIRLTGVLGAAEGSIPAYRLAYLIFSADIVGSDAITLSDEHGDYKWVSPEEALQLDLCSAFIPFVKSLVLVAEPPMDTKRS